MQIEVLASGSKGNAYLITGYNQTLLLEAGLPFRELKQKLGFKLPDACFVTHEHKDHAKCARDLIRLGVPTYMTLGTSKALDLHGFSLYILTYDCNGTYYQARIGQFLILPFIAQHDAAEPVGFLIKYLPTNKTILFITDSYYCKYKFSGVNLAMIECNYSKDILEDNIKNNRAPASIRDRIVQSHFELENVKDMLQSMDKSRLERVMLIHLSETNSDEERFKREVQEVSGVAVDIAVPGLKINL